MLYKVTPMLTPTEKKPAAPKQAKDPNAPKEPRKRRKSAVYDAEGHEVLITMMCLKCRSMKPLAMFGLRKMADGAIRNQPWCRTCRSGASTKKRLEPTDVEVLEQATEAPEPLTLSAGPMPTEQLPLVAEPQGDASAADEGEGEESPVAADPNDGAHA